VTRSAFLYVTNREGYDLVQHSALSVALSQPAPITIHIQCHQFLPNSSDHFTKALATLGAKLTSSRVTTPCPQALSAVAELIDHYDRIIYLSKDILVFADLKIDEIEFGEFPVAAVVDMDLSVTGALRYSMWSAGKGVDIGSYFNSGVMIFAAEKWRGQIFMDDYASSLDEHHVTCPFKVNCTSIDQCALNFTFWGMWRRLPTSYNMQAGAKFTAAWKTAAVRNYCGGRNFLPIATFRSDKRDAGYLKTIRKTLGYQSAWLPFLYEIPFQLNALRKYRSDTSMRRFLHALQL
jgi:hypothetical protein